MLLNYKFKNYKTYANDVEFTMIANKDKSHNDKLINWNKYRVSPAKVIYGANASGKTSFIDSVQFINAFAHFSNLLLDGGRINVIPFKFRKDFANLPSTFNICFVKNDVKYDYSFSCTAEQVFDEKLDIYYSAKPTNIFTRTNSNEYQFKTDIKVLNEIKEKNTANKLFLITAATWNYEKVKPVVDFITNDIIVYDNTQKMQHWAYDINYVIKHNDIDEYREFCLEFLNSADISISNFNVDVKKIDENSSINDIIDNLYAFSTGTENDKAVKVFSINTFHEIESDLNTQTYSLKLKEESMGTRQLFDIAPTLFYVFKYGKTLFIDEIDRSLHPLLVEYIVKKFSNKDLNKNNAQLICNTHDTNLLDLDIFRRDEIYFAERDNKTGISELYSLAEFSPRKNENIEKAYMLGRFGAIPFIKED